jgi:hypothetical protein
MAIPRLSEPLTLGVTKSSSPPLHTMNHPLIPRDQFERMAANQVLQSLKQGPNRSQQDTLNLLPYSVGLQLNQPMRPVSIWDSSDMSDDWDNVF